MKMDVLCLTLENEELSCGTPVRAATEKPNASVTIFTSRIQVFAHPTFIHSQGDTAGTHSGFLLFLL